MKFIVDISSLETNFSDLKDPAAFLDSIKKREMSIEEARQKQEKFNRYLKKIRTGNKSEKKNTLVNFDKLFNERSDAIKFVHDYRSMILGANLKRLKKNLNQTHQKQKLNAKNLH